MSPFSIALPLLCCTLALPAHAGLHSITPEALALRQSRASAPVVLDVRTPEEYAAGHVPGAILVPHDAIDEYRGFWESFSDQEIVVYCRSGRRALEAEEQLQRLGVTNLRQMEGHWQAWDAAHLPEQQGSMEAGS